MALRILHDRRESIACLYDSVTDTAFGPVFYGDTPELDAQAFIDWLPLDARRYDPDVLHELYGQWLREVGDDDLV